MNKSQFVRIGGFQEGFAQIKDINNGIWNFIDRNGNILNPNLWFIDVRPFHNGFARVQRPDFLWNYISKQGEILYPKQWFSWIDIFHKSCWARIRRESDHMWNFINQDGRLMLADSWAEHLDSFHEGFAVIQRKGDSMKNFIDENGVMLSKDFWFSWADSFHKGRALVMNTNGKFNFIGQNGKLLSPQIWFDNITQSRTIPIGIDNKDIYYVDKSNRFHKLIFSLSS